MISQSEVMKNLMNQIDRVAPSNASVLVVGETGTGKQMLTKILHEKSSRQNKPFITLNCAALRETLLDSELFGHEKGSFTGAYTRKIGLMEIANGGTMVLTQVHELTPGMQAKLLQFIHSGNIYRVGGKDPIPTNVRIISTTTDLEDAVNKGTFREDLFYRINAITLRMPTLRDRKDDIEELTTFFLPPTKEMSSEAMEILKEYKWPGNVRELENTCARLEILVEGNMIQPEDIPNNIKNGYGPDEGEYNPSISLHDLEKQHILKSLKYFDNNKAKAAAALGITIKTLYNKLHMYGVL